MPVFIEDFRSADLTDDEIIQKAVTSAAPGAMIYFEPGRIYTLHNRVLVKQFQTLVGNNATLKRADESFTILDSIADASADSLFVDSIPPGWKAGDQIQIFTDSYGGHSNEFGDYPKLPNIITRIETNKIFLSARIGGSADGSINTWPKGATIRKVFTMLRGDSIQLRSAPFSVLNMNFDGNKSRNLLNYYWNVNSTIFVKGLGSKIEDCRFYNIPNENIVGHGIYVSNCQAKDLNGSFIHFSGTDTIKLLPQKNSVIIGNTMENLCILSTRISGHSEGAFTTSYTGGYATIVNNRIYNCGEAAIGAIISAQNIADGGRSEFIIQGNLFKNCRQIISSIHFIDPERIPTTDIYISGNIFSNCGINDWTKFSGYRKFIDIKVGENQLTNGTKWIY